MYWLNWNDFIACGEYLVSEKYTSPAHLAGQGGSAGGILKRIYQQSKTAAVGK